MPSKLHEALRWIFLACYVGFSVLIYTTHFIQRNTPVAIVILIFLGCLLLAGFKLTEGKRQNE